MARIAGQLQRVELHEMTFLARVGWGAWRQFQDDLSALEDAQVAYRQQHPELAIIEEGVDATSYPQALNTMRDAASLRFVVACVRGWEGIVDADGQPAPFSAEALEAELSPVETVRLQAALMGRLSAMPPELQASTPEAPNPLGASGSPSAAPTGEGAP